MRRRADQERPPLPDWLLSPDGRFLVDVPTMARWCEENGWRKFDALLEARNCHRAALGIGDDEREW